MRERKKKKEGRGREPRRDRLRLGFRGSLAWLFQFKTFRRRLPFSPFASFSPAFSFANSRVRSSSTRTRKGARARERRRKEKKPPRDSRVDERHVGDACERLRDARAGLSPPDDDDSGRRGHAGGRSSSSDYCRCWRDRGRQLGRGLKGRAPVGVSKQE